MSYTLRINPVAPYDGPGMERWLETCAATSNSPSANRWMFIFPSSTPSSAQMASAR